MKENNLKESLVSFLTEFFPDLESKLDDLEAVNFYTDYGLDSITFVTMVIRIEEAFNIIIPTEHIVMENFVTFNKIQALINRCMNE